MSDAMDPRHADPDRYSEKLRSLRSTHYCKTCKRMIPLSPGVLINPVYTLGVAHAGFSSFSGDLLPCSDVMHRTYSPDEQVRNLEDLLEGTLINDGTFIIGPGLGHPGPNPGPPRVPLPPTCTACNGEGMDLDNPNLPTLCSTCRGSGHLGRQDDFIDQNDGRGGTWSGGW